MGDGAATEFTLTWEGPRGQIPQLEEVLRTTMARYDVDDQGVITSAEQLEMLLTNVIFSLQLPLFVADVSEKMPEVRISEQQPWTVQDVHAWLTGQLEAG